MTETPRNTPENPAASCTKGMTAPDDAQRAAIFEKIRLNQCQWPIQIKLVLPNAPYFDRAKLLIAADCCAFACKDFHSRCREGSVTLIGCPKLDGVDYSEKLTAIIAGNDIESVSVARMEVPCCSGLEGAVRKALENSGKPISCHVVTISINGEIIVG